MKPPKPPISLETLGSLVGSNLGKSSWILVDQDRIDQFAAATEDHQFIHVDEARAKEGPFGCTIAHGFLLLSFCAAITMEVVPPIENVGAIINYGSNAVRFLSPVRVGSRVRGDVTLVDLIARNPGKWLATYRIKLEIEGEPKPALFAEILGMLYFEKDNGGDAE